MRSTIFACFVTMIFQVSHSALGQSLLTDSQCEELSKKISSEIKGAGTCSSVADCKDVWLGCPFGCGTAVRSSEESHIRAAVEAFNRQCPVCKYNCQAGKRELKCVDSQCVLEFVEHRPADL